LSPIHRTPLLGFPVHPMYTESSTLLGSVPESHRIEYHFLKELLTYSGLISVFPKIDLAPSAISINRSLHEVYARRGTAQDLPVAASFGHSGFLRYWRLGGLV